MKLLTALLTLLLSSAPVRAQDPSNCNTEDKARKGSDFVFRARPDNPNVTSLSSIFSADNRRVSVADVFNDGNHKMTSHPLGSLTWESVDGFDDVNTKKWYPQGISSTADALGAGIYEGKDGFVVSWHNGEDTSARITFVDRDTLQYRHLLLVYPHEEDNFRAAPVHAGGIVWYGNTLWVVDTKYGIRVFDMDNIWQVDSGDGVGKKSGGGYSAQGYKYVVPQIMWYEWTPDFPFRFSYISLDRTTSPDSIMVGEFQPDSTKVPIRMVQWDLDYTLRRLKANGDGLAAARWAYCVDIENVQGAVQVDGTIYASQSDGQTRGGKIWTWTPGSSADTTGALPAGPEDFSYDNRSQEIFTVTEWPGNRWIVGSKVGELQLP